MIIYGSRHAWPFCLFLAWLNSSEYFLVKIHLWPQTEKKISFLNSTVCPHFDELFSSHIWKPRFFNICNILTQCQTVLEFVVFALRELNEIYLIYEFLIFFRNKRKIADKADWGELAWSCVRWFAWLCGVHGSVVPSQRRWCCLRCRPTSCPLFFSSVPTYSSLAHLCPLFQTRQVPTSFLPSSPALRSP